MAFFTLFQVLGARCGEWPLIKYIDKVGAVDGLSTPYWFLFGNIKTGPGSTCPNEFKLAVVHEGKMFCRTQVL
jgi:hypothetical protein